MKRGGGGGGTHHEEEGEGVLTMKRRGRGYSP